MILAGSFGKTYLEAMCIEFISVFSQWLIFGRSLGLCNSKIKRCNWGTIISRFGCYM